MESKIEQMSRIAVANKGKCLSKHYINNVTKLKWVCEFGHVWEATPTSISEGTWCRVCFYNRRRSNILDLQKFARLKEGKLISTEYKNSQTKMQWQCKYGHYWRATWSNIKRGKWCPYCAKNARLDIQHLQIIASDRGGKLVSKVYNRSSEKLIWECKYKHRWSANANNIISKKSWCPYCCGFLGESICRKAFELLFNKQFSKMRHVWIVSDKNRPLELDGYNEELMMAFEHQGKHHYSETAYTYENLDDIQRRDLLKVEACKKRGVRLFIIPEIFSQTKLENLLSIINRQAEIFGIKVNNNDIDFDSLISNCYLEYTDITVNELSEYRKNTLKQMSFNNKSLLKKSQVVCEVGHRWMGNYFSIKAGHWCPTCARNKPYKITNMRNIAKMRDGKCISKEYKGATVDLQWWCNKCKFQWTAPPTRIIQGGWCPKCAGKFVDIDDINKLAQSNNSICLSDTYIKQILPLKWRCILCNFEWSASYKNMKKRYKRNVWCKRCK